MITEGLTRSYFYQRFADDIRQVLGREDYPEERQQNMVVKVNIQDSLDRLAVCPVCGNAFEVDPDAPLERSDDCGDFTITEVWGNGDVTFTYTMVGSEE